MRICTGIPCLSANVKIVLKIGQFHGKMDASIAELCPICINIPPQVALTTVFKEKNICHEPVSVAKKE